MFKKFLIICTTLIMATISVAQEIAPENLLNIEQYQKRLAQPYQGGTFVHIDLPQQKITEPTFNPIPLRLMGNYPIKTPFGQETQAAFVAHTTDFISIIQILNNTDIMMQQTIQFVNTKGQDYFIRTFNLPDDAQMMLINAKRNNQPIDTLKIAKENHVWTIKDNTPLPSGIYSYTLSYLIKRIVKSQDNKNHLRLSLTGANWGLPTERFSAIVLLPSKVSVDSQTLLFGSNNVQIDDGFISQNDDKGVTYRLTRPLPAYADVKIDMVLDQIPVPSFSEHLAQHFNHFLFFLCLGILVMYTLLTRLYLSHHKNDKIPLKELSYYSYISLRFVVGNVSPTFLNTLIQYSKETKKKIKSPTFLVTHPFWIKPFVFLNIMRKYLWTMGLIIGLTVFQAANTGFALTISEIIALLITMCLLNIWLYHSGEKDYIHKKMSLLHDTLFVSNIAFGASLSSLKALYIRFYPYALIMNKDKKWTELMNKYQLDTSHYHFNGGAK